MGREAGEPRRGKQRLLPCRPPALLAGSLAAQLVNQALVAAADDDQLAAGAHLLRRARTGTGWAVAAATWHCDSLACPSLRTLEPSLAGLAGSVAGERGAWFSRLWQGGRPPARRLSHRRHGVDGLLDGPHALAAADQKHRWRARVPP